MDFLFFNTLYKKVYADENLNEAWRMVRNNGNSPGVDGITPSHFGGNLFINLKNIQEKLRRKEYAPQKIKRIYIDKGNEGKRPLGLLTVRDKVVQRAVLHVIQPLFESSFLPCNYAFRKGMSGKMAMDEARKYIRSGLRWVVDLDIESFFETIEKDKLFSLVKQKVTDRNIRRMIHSWIYYELSDNQPVNGAGIIQGSPLSPLFANIYLHELDKEAMRKGLKFLRYCDDILLFCNAYREAEKTLKTAKKMLRKVSLRVNEQKTRIVQVNGGLKFLGEELY